MCKNIILVVDDNEPLRIACRHALEHAGYTVVAAKHGVEALALAQRHLPSLVILDLDMPVLDGWQTQRGLALDVRTAGIPVVAHTAEYLADRCRMREAGFRAHIDKGTGTRYLARHVRWLLDQDLEHRAWIELPSPCCSGRPAGAGAPAGTAYVSGGTEVARCGAPTNSLEDR